MTQGFLWKVSSYLFDHTGRVCLRLEVIWNDIDLYHAYRDFTTDPVRYPVGDLREFISDLASVRAPGGRVLIDMRTIVGRKRATLCADRGCGDSRVNQQDRYCMCVADSWSTALTSETTVPTLSDWEGFVSRRVDGGRCYLAKAFFRDVFVKNPDGTEHVGQVTDSPLDMRPLIRTEPS